MLGFSSLLGTGREGAVFALAAWEEEVIYNSAEKCNKLNQHRPEVFNGLLFCCFFVDPRCTQGSSEPSWLAPLALHPKNPPIHWLWMCCLFCGSHSILLFDDDISSAGHSVNTLQVVKKKNVCKLNLICFKMIFVIEVPAVTRIEHLGVTVV